MRRKNGVLHVLGCVAYPRAADDTPRVAKAPTARSAVQHRRLERLLNCNPGELGAAFLNAIT